MSDESPTTGGPLAGIRVVELAGLGPAPVGAMMLADQGAAVVRIDRPVGGGAPSDVRPDPVLGRGKRSIALDLKAVDDLEVARQLVRRADVVIDPFRPGVVERLGLGPDVFIEENPGLVYARMTGWGQTGPRAAAAGHDVNYIAVTGALHGIGPADRPPVVPLNLVGDYGGGAMLLVYGVTCALVERARTGLGQVVDVAMVDGAATLMALFCQRLAEGDIFGERGSDWLDGSSHWYGAYETADGGFITIGSLEPQFYDILLERLALDPEAWPQWERGRWPDLRRRLAAIFRTQPAAYWQALLEDTDACFAPALSLRQAFDEPHVTARGTYVRHGGIHQPAPAPRFARTPGAIGGPAPCVDEHGAEIRAELSRDG